MRSSARQDPIRRSSLLVASGRTPCPRRSGIACNGCGIGAAGTVFPKSDAHRVLALATATNRWTAAGDPLAASPRRFSSRAACSRRRCGRGRGDAADGAVAVAAVADVLEQPEARHIGRRPRCVCAQVRSRVAGLDVRRQRTVHVDRLQGRRAVRPDLVLRRPSPAHRTGVGRPDQERLRRLPRHRCSLEVRGSPPLLRRSLPVPR